MPKSQSPRKRAYTPPTRSKTKAPTPQWYKYLMVGLMLAGLAWIVATYLGLPTSTKGGFPIPTIGNWNLAVGFGMALVGFAMTTRWR